MKSRFAVTVLFVALVSPALLAEDAEEAAIIDAINRSYVQGVHVQNSPKLMRSGMHESFVMFSLTDEGVKQTTRAEWIARIKPRPEGAPEPNIKADIKVLDRSGNAAIARVELHRDGKHIFTDYISLYRFDDGWKLVAKTFMRH
jgi:hypothetical protein